MLVLVLSLQGKSTAGRVKAAVVEVIEGVGEVLDVAATGNQTSCTVTVRPYRKRTDEARARLAAFRLGAG